MQRVILLALAMGVALAAIPAAASAAPYRGMYLNQTELDALGAVPSDLTACATGTYQTPNVSDQNNQGDADAFCGALYYAKTGNTTARTKVRTS